jgi:hypothetical protein
MRTLEGKCSYCSKWEPVDYILIDTGEVHYFCSKECLLRWLQN